jgi:hypothetical protein
MVELRTVDHMMDFGRVVAAFFVSSATKGQIGKSEEDSYIHIWTELSNPKRETTNGLRPTMKLTPLLPQPPLFVNSVNTAFELFLGARIHSGIMMANKPTI